MKHVSRVFLSDVTVREINIEHKRFTISEQTFNHLTNTFKICKICKEFSINLTEHHIM